MNNSLLDVLGRVVVSKPQSLKMFLPLPDKNCTLFLKNLHFHHCRFGPRQIRVESALLRSYNSGTRAAPYESLMVADIGDVNVNVYDLKDTCKRIRDAYRTILATGCIPLTMGESG